ncbi:MAG: hypothetical protein H6R04_68 [Burkholderiaceae bacterium]|nr:hypothetical protein [Burkholderiaceae bacterium]
MVTGTASRGWTCIRNDARMAGYIAKTMVWAMFLLAVLKYYPQYIFWPNCTKPTFESVILA